MELKLQNGDYVSDGVGGVVRLTGAGALLQRVLYRLTARRGQFPFLPEMGSELYRLGTVPAAERLSVAKQYVAQALSEEAVSVTDVTLTERSSGAADLTVYLTYEGETLSLSVPVR